MTKQETAKIMAVLKVMYPQYYAKQDEAEQRAAVNAWHRYLADYDYRVAQAAVDMVVVSSKYPPSVAEVLEKVRAIAAPEILDEAEAWQRVTRAVINGGGREEFDKLPEECKAVVGSPRQLKDWGSVPEREYDTVVASNFMRLYRVRAQKAKEYAALPASVKGVLGEIKMLGAGDL